MEEAVRWNIKVSKETDLTLRTFLGSRGMKKGDLSKFIEEAVRWRVFHGTVQDIKSRNADTDPQEADHDQRSGRKGSGRRAALKGRPTRPDACRARYQYFGVGSSGPDWISGHHLSCLERGEFHSSD